MEEDVFSHLVSAHPVLRIDGEDPVEYLGQNIEGFLGDGGVRLDLHLLEVETLVTLGVDLIFHVNA